MDRYEIKAIEQRLLYDEAYRAGLKEGYNLGVDEKAPELNRRVNSLTDQITQVRRELATRNRRTKRASHGS